jgi:hypothetical protein
VAWVPGSFELPVVAKAMAKSGKYDAVVAIGVVVSQALALGLGSCAAVDPALDDATHMQDMLALLQCRLVHTAVR